MILPEDDIKFGETCWMPESIKKCSLKVWLKNNDFFETGGCSHLGKPNVFCQICGNPTSSIQDWGRYINLGTMVMDKIKICFNCIED